MPNKLRLNIDLAKIQGAMWFTSPKTGEKCLVIVPSKSRAKYYPSKQADREDSLYEAIEIVPFKNPPIDREDTHFAVEPLTRDERESPAPPKLPILGSAREYEPYATAKPASAAQHIAPKQEAAAEIIGEDDDEIPF